MKFVKFAVMAGVMVAFAAADAAENAVASCYAMVNIGMVQAKPAHEIFVLVDQTVLFDDGVKASINERLLPLLRPGTAYSVASFSAYGQGRYPVIISSGVTEASVPATMRNDISVPKLKKLDDCLRAQLPFASRTMLAATAMAISGSSGGLANSEILASLKQLSARVAASPARKKTVVIISDMIEHSTITSFYSKSILRKIDPDVEFAKATAAGLVANFGGAETYVIGAGALPADKPSARRGTAEMTSLERFWRQWLNASRADLEEFGEPLLLKPIG